MSDSLPSWITLSAFLVSAIILLVRSTDRSLHAIIMNLLNATFCFFGGLLIAGIAMKLSGGIDSPLANSSLVVVGALLCVGGKELLGKRRKANSQ